MPVLDVWSFAIMASGVLSAKISGMQQMLKLFVVSLDYCLQVLVLTMREVVYYITTDI